jgi:hypothetical protein
MGVCGPVERIRNVGTEDGCELGEISGRSLS